MKIRIVDFALLIVLCGALATSGGTLAHSPAVEQALQSLYNSIDIKHRETVGLLRSIPLLKTTFIDQLNTTIETIKYLRPAQLLSTPSPLGPIFRKYGDIVYHAYSSIPSASRAEEQVYSHHAYWCSNLLEEGSPFYEPLRQLQTYANTACNGLSSIFTKLHQIMLPQAYSLPTSGIPARNLVHKNISAMHEQTIKFITSIPNKALNYAAKENLIHSLNNKIETISSMTRLHMLPDNGDTVLRKIFIDYSDILYGLHYTVPTSYKDHYSAISKHSSCWSTKLLQKDSPLHEPLQQLRLRQTDSAIPFFLKLTVSAWGIYGLIKLHDWHEQKAIVRLCRNNDVPGLITYINNIFGGTVDQIAYNDNQALRESAKEGYFQIIRILLQQGANIAANNYEAVQNALERNSANTIAVIFEHLQHTNLLDAAYQAIADEEMWTHLSSEKTQKNYAILPGLTH